MLSASWRYIDYSIHQIVPSKIGTGSYDVDSVTLKGVDNLLSRRKRGLLRWRLRTTSWPTVYDGAYHRGMLYITPLKYTTPSDRAVRANNVITGGVIDTVIYRRQRALAPWMIVVYLVVLN